MWGGVGGSLGGAGELLWESWGIAAREVAVDGAGKRMGVVLGRLASPANGGRSGRCRRAVQGGVGGGLGDV